MVAYGCRMTQAHSAGDMNPPDSRAQGGRSAGARSDHALPATPPSASSWRSSRMRSRATQNELSHGALHTVPSHEWSCQATLMLRWVVSISMLRQRPTPGCVHSLEFRLPERLVSYVALVSPALFCQSKEAGTRASRGSLNNCAEHRSVCGQFVDDDLVEDLTDLPPHLVAGHQQPHHGGDVLVCGQTSVLGRADQLLVHPHIGRRAPVARHCDASLVFSSPE